MPELEVLDYSLPAEAIAPNPAEPRDSAKLLVLQGAELSHHTFRDLPKLLNPGDLLVLNNTRVSALRLIGRRTTGGAVEALLLRPEGKSTYEALVKPAKRLRAGAVIEFEHDVRATVVSEGEGGLRTLSFGDLADLQSRLAEIGSTPLPPYIYETSAPPSRYQTVYASVPGSSAAPTAGLHFTDAVFEALRTKGVDIAYVTLDVGIDTFRPVTGPDHKMHGERYFVPPETASAIRDARGRVIAVGTTTVRTLETAAIGHRSVRAGEGCSSLFIKPGYRFHVVDGMITNFHMPHTSMLFMVAAMCGGVRLANAYQTALDAGYRFLSFGDAMLIIDQTEGD